jgi:predicted transposase YdaD
MKYVTTIERMAKEEGKVEEKQTIAINLLRQGLAIEAIAQATGLTTEQLQQLQAKNQ